MMGVSHNIIKNLLKRLSAAAGSEEVEQIICF
jgi:hypothetical protein